MNPSKLKKFESWIVENGGEVLLPTSQWEALRYRTEQDGVCVVYINRRGDYNFTGVTEAHADYFSRGKPMLITKRIGKADVRQSLRDTIRERDGNKCFYCRYPLENGERATTLEHLLSVSHGGNNHVSNLCLACELCNTAVGNMSIVEKVNFRDSKLNQAA